MPIIDPLRSPIYESGALIQQCYACQWAQRGHRSEIAECPSCGASLDAPIGLAFGGAAILYDGRNFEVYNRWGKNALMERSDVPEIAQFICRHAEDLRTGKIIMDGGLPRRVSWRQGLSNHFFQPE